MVHGVHALGKPQTIGESESLPALQHAATRKSYKKKRHPFPSCQREVWAKHWKFVAFQKEFEAFIIFYICYSLLMSFTSFDSVWSSFTSSFFTGAREKTCLLCFQFAHPCLSPDRDAATKGWKATGKQLAQSKPTSHSEKRIQHHRTCNFGNEPTNNDLIWSNYI